MEVKQVSEKQYFVRSNPESTWRTVFINGYKASCTCPDFVFRGMKRSCKHIKSVYIALDNFKNNSSE
ncbi:SWIM zinc finger family protein [Candidatus Undinarchaeota archaeon]